MSSQAQYTKSFKKQKTDKDQAKSNEAIMQLKDAFHKIFTHRETDLPFDVLYRHGYILVTQKNGELLYCCATTTISNNALALSHPVRDAHEEVLLHRFNVQWDRHFRIVSSIHNVLMYMDRTFVQQEKKTSIPNVGMLEFQEKVVRAFEPRIQTQLFKLVQCSRQGEFFDAEVFCRTINTLIALAPDTLSVYESTFEGPFLQMTAEFYTKEALEFLTRSTAPAYLMKAEERIAEENHRVQSHLHPSTGPKLQAILDQVLISDTTDAIIAMEGSGTTIMFKEGQVENLALIYRLFSRVPSSLLALKRTMYDIVLSDGKTLMGEADCIPKLIDMMDKYKELINVAFGGDRAFQISLRDSFTIFMNIGPKCAHLLAAYVDIMMKRGFKSKTEVEIDACLDKVIRLFHFLRDKDVFESFYQEHMQKRLLGNRSVSIEAEKSMITKLKTASGFYFTRKLEGLINDLSTSKELMDAYNHVKPSGLADIQATVLMHGNGPSDTFPTCILPSVVAACAADFQKFYLSRHTGRRLTWQMSQGTADVRALYTSKRHELTVSTFQLCILMMFNAADGDELTFKALLDGTNIPVDEMKRHLLSLTTPKQRIIIKTKKGKEILDNDVFKLNRAYTSPMIRVKVPLISLRSPALAKEATIPLQVEEGRRHAIDAAIVRVMKARKTLDHSNIVAEVTSQLTRFRPSPVDIKRRIESLIEREYLERSEDNQRMYNYLA